MITSTIILDRADDSWRSIVNTGEFMVLAGQTSSFRLRFGISSDSEGMIINPGESLRVEETVYVRPILRTNDKRQYITLYAHKG